MAERYTRVFTQQGQFYCPDAPVIIEAGALLKDNQTGKTIAQLKFKNISPNTIRALTVKISATDVTGAAVAGVDNFQYLDLNVSRDGEFGQQTPIVLPDATARSFTCQCLSAVLGDKTIWNCTENTKWVPLPKPCALASKMGTPLAEQYKRDTMPKAQYIPVEHDGLWSCACGAMNHANEQVCHSCRGSKAALFGALNIEKLQANKKKHDDVIAAEKAAVAEAEKIRAAKTKKIAVIVAVAIVLLIGVFVFTSEVIVPATKYDNAISLMDEGKYEDAQEIFLELEDYQDAAAKYTECEWKKGLALYLSGERDQANQIFSKLMAGGQLYPEYVITAIDAYWREEALKCIDAELYDSAISSADNTLGGSTVKDEVLEILYQKATSILAEEKYDDAEKLVELLSGYKDADTLVNEAKYQEALSLLEAGSYDIAHSIFTSLTGYKDANTLASEALYQKALSLFDAGSYDSAHSIFASLTDYRNANALAKESLYQQANAYLAEKDYDKSNPIFLQIINYRDSIDKIHYHDYTVTDSKKETCTTDGFNTYYCAGCQDGYTETVKATGHSYSDATCTNPKTCSICGKTEGAKLGHTTSNGICERCKADFRQPPVTLEQLQGSWIFRYNNGFYYRLVVQGSQATYYFKQNQDFEYGYYTGPITITKTGFKIGPARVYWHYPDCDVLAAENSWQIFDITEFTTAFFVTDNDWKFIKE